MKNLFCTLFFTMFVIFSSGANLGCEGIVGFKKDHYLEKKENRSMLYFNSFESDNDIIGWQGTIEVKSEAAPDGGKKSLFVSGGCVIPHNSLEINVTEDSYLVLRCWGKDLAIGGSVVLELEDGSESIYIHINKTQWTAYESQDQLFCPANTKLKLSLNSGGFVPSSMLVDLVAIEKVN